MSWYYIITLIGKGKPCEALHNTTVLTIFNKHCWLPILGHKQSAMDSKVNWRISERYKTQTSYFIIDTKTYAKEKEK